MSSLGKDMGRVMGKALGKAMGKAMGGAMDKAMGKAMGKIMGRVLGYLIEVEGIWVHLVHMGQPGCQHTLLAAVPTAIHIHLCNLSATHNCTR